MVGVSRAGKAASEVEGLGVLNVDRVGNALFTNAKGEQKLRLRRLLAFVAMGQLFLSQNIYAQDCGEVSITNILTGPRHGAMMQVDPACSEWVCLDPDGEHMSQKESDRLFAFILSQHAANNKIILSVKDGVYAAACNGPYPVVDDARLK